MHTEALHRRFLHKRFYTQTLLHTDTFTHRNFYTQPLWHTDALTQSTQKLLSRRFYTNAFTQMLFTHRSFHTQHTEALYTQKKLQFYLSLWRSTSFRAKGLRRTPSNRNFTSVFGDRTSFRAKGLRGTSWNRNFTCVSCRLVGTAPAPAFRREIKKKERARGQEGKRARGQEQKMWRCEDVKMWR